VLFRKTDHDLVELVSQVLTIFPVTILHKWVKSHYTGKKKELKHHLNNEAECLMGAYQQHQTPHHTIRQPLMPPNHRIRLLFDSSVIRSKLYSHLVRAIHDRHLEQHILNKTQWGRVTFTLVHWDAYERAFKKLPRYNQHNMAKSVHCLLNTNKQNKLYYGDSPLYPICHDHEETMEHVFTYKHPAAITNREHAWLQFKLTLKN
jgi:hypothetical protein